jgi:hypothetical protein
MPPALVYALAAGIVIVALGVAASLLVLAFRLSRLPDRFDIEQGKERVVDQVVRSFNDDLTMLRSQRFGLSMAPRQRLVPRAVPPPLPTERKA